MAVVSRLIHIDGKVQGVFFRASTKNEADELNIKGFVRNEANGSVYIEAEGDEDAMRRFLEWCKKGPRMARVDRCDITEGVIKGFKSFTISR